MRFCERGFSMNTVIRKVVLALTILTSMALAYPVSGNDYWASQYGIGKGSKIILHVPLAVDADHYKVFIQGGEVKNNKKNSYSWSFDQYHPFCYFELGTPSGMARTIQPGEFAITRVRIDETEFVQPGPIQVAGLLSSYDAPVLIVELLIMELKSETQSDVEQLVCANGFDFPGQVEMPTIEQIRNALGGIAMLDLVK